MPGIKRIQTGYSVGEVNFHKDDDHEEEEDKPRPQYCVRCKDMFSVYSLLSPRVIRLTKLQVNHFQSLQIMISGWNVWAAEHFMKNTK